MNFEPVFTITPKLLSCIEEITALREKILASTVQVSWIPALRNDTQIRNAHSSTAIEGNPLTLEQVRALAAGQDLPATTERSKREVLNYFAGLRFIEKNLKKRSLTHEDVLRLHKVIAGGGVMDQGSAGQYRTIGVSVGRYMPPPASAVSGLMFELLEWWNKEAMKLSAGLTPAIIHHRFESIHPFADGNGRVGRALALWELYRRGFDTHHIFAVDEWYWEDRPRYYTELDAGRHQGGDLSRWLEYSAEGLKVTLEKAWVRVQRMAAQAGHKKLVLRPKQEQLIQMLRDRRSMSPQEIWDAIGISKQGALDLLKPLIKAGLVRRIGTNKSGRYILV